MIMCKVSAVGCHCGQSSSGHAPRSGKAFGLTLGTDVVCTRARWVNSASNPDVRVQVLITERIVGQRSNQPASRRSTPRLRTHSGLEHRSYFRFSFEFGPVLPVQFHEFTRDAQRLDLRGRLEYGPATDHFLGFGKGAVGHGDGALVRRMRKPSLLGSKPPVSTRDPSCRDFWT